MSMRGIINLETYVKREAAAEGTSRLDYAGGIAVNWGVNKGRHVCRGPRDRRLGHRSDLLPALKGEGSLRAVHRFAAYRPHLHHIMAGGRICTHPAAPLVQRQAAGRAFGPLPLPLAGSCPHPLGPRGLGICGAPVGVSPCGDTICSAMLSSAQVFYALPRPWKGQGLPFVLSLAT